MRRMDERVVLYSAGQRDPVAGEPTCVICGRFGEYTATSTGVPVCSLQCLQVEAPLWGTPSKSGQAGATAGVGVQLRVDDYSPIVSDVHAGKVAIRMTGTAHKWLSLTSELYARW